MLRMPASTRGEFAQLLHKKQVVHRLCKRRSEANMDEKENKKLIEGEWVSIEDLYKKHKAMIVRVSRPFGYRHGAEDAQSTAAIGMINAFNNFDESRGMKFSTYLYQEMRFELHKLGRKCTSGIHVASDVQTVRNAIVRKGLEYESVDEIEKVLPYKRKKIIFALKAIDVSSMHRLDAPTASGVDGTDMTDVIGEVDDLSTLYVEECLELFTERQKKILIGLVNSKSKEGIADELGVTYQTIWREMKAIRKKYMENMGV